MTTKMQLPNQHLAYLKALSKPTEYQRLLIELYEKDEHSPIENKKLMALIKTEKAHLRAMKAKKEMQQLLNAEANKEKALQRKQRTKRLIELGALFDIANLGHHDPATLVGMLSNIRIAPDDPKWTNWHTQGVSILQQRKQAKNAKQAQSEDENN